MEANFDPKNLVQSLYLLESDDIETVKNTKELVTNAFKRSKFQFSFYYVN